MTLHLQNTPVRYSVMIFHRNYFFNTTSKVDVMSVIHEVNRAIRESGVKDGLAIAYLPEAGGALTIIEPLPGILEKFKETLKLFLDRESKVKNRLKEDVDVGPRVAAAMLQKTLSIPFNEGRLVMGNREEPMLIDFMTAVGRRELFVQVMGDGGEAKQGGQIPQQMQRARR